MNEPVYILGAGRTDFKRNLRKEGKSLRDVIEEAGRAALEDAEIDPAEIQAAAVGNFNAGQFTKQLHLGAFMPEIDEKLHGIPTMHTEAACASGSLSVLLGAQWIMGGFHDAVLVVGAEQQKTMSSTDGSDVLGAAADFDSRASGIRRLHVPEIVRAHRRRSTSINTARRPTTWPRSRGKITRTRALIRSPRCVTPI